MKGLSDMLEELLFGKVKKMLEEEGIEDYKKAKEIISRKFRLSKTDAEIILAWLVLFGGVDLYNGKAKKRKWKK